MGIGREMGDRVRGHVATGGWQQHPVGTYAGTVESVEGKQTPAGADLYEVKVRTAAGVAKATIWHKRADMIDEDADRAGVGIDEATERYEKHIARICRLYKDLGLAVPSDDAEDISDIEQACYERLGELEGRECTVVVKENRDKPDQPFIFINAPAAAEPAPRAAAPRPQAARPPAAQGRQAAPAARTSQTRTAPARAPAQRQAPAPRRQDPPSAFGGPATPGLDDIPF